MFSGFHQPQNPFPSVLWIPPTPEPFPECSPGPTNPKTPSLNVLGIPPTPEPFPGRASGPTNPRNLPRAGLEIFPHPGAAPSWATTQDQPRSLPAPSGAGVTAWILGLSDFPCEITTPDRAERAGSEALIAANYPMGGIVADDASLVPLMSAGRDALKRGQRGLRSSGSAAPTPNPPFDDSSARQSS